MPDTVTATPETTQAAPPADAQVQTQAPPSEPAQPAAPVEPVAVKTEPQIPPDVAEYMARLEQQSARARELEEAQTLQAFLADRAKDLEARQGLTPEQAQYITGLMGQMATKAREAEQFLIGQTNAAIEIGERYGISPKKIRHLPTPDAMIQEAIRLTTQATAQAREAARVKQLEAEVATLKKQLAPVQKFDTGTQSAPGSTRAGPVTGAQLAAMTPAEYAEWRKTGLKSK